MPPAGSAVFSATSRRALAGLIALALAMLTVVSGFGGTANAATSGTINSFLFSTTAIGTTPVPGLDPELGDRDVPSNDAVVFRWQLNVSDLVDGTLTQTLPAGWQWDATSLGALTATTPYQASHTLSADGRTLTATVSGNGVLVFSGLSAIPDGSIPNGSTYTPVLTVTDVNGPQTQTLPDITVVNEVRVDVGKTTIGAANRNYDFGSGMVPAKMVEFEIVVDPTAGPNGDIGAADRLMSSPLVIDDAFTLPASVTTWAVEKTDPYYFTTTPANLGVATTRTGNNVRFSLTNFGALPAVFRISVYAPESQMPGTNQSREVRNTVSAVNWTDTDGNPVSDWNPNNNTAYADFPTGTSAASGATSSKQDYALVDQGATAWPGGASPILPNHTRPGQYTPAGNVAIGTGALVATKTNVNFPQINGFMAYGATNLFAYDFWDPSEKRIQAWPFIVSKESTNNRPVTAADYTVAYTSGTTPAGPWFPSIAAAGGPENVRGFRVSHPTTYMGGAPVNAVNQTQFVVAAMFKVVATTAGTLIDNTASWTFDEGAVNNAVSSYRLSDLPRSSMTKRASDPTTGATITSVLTGNPVTYTISPVVLPPLGVANAPMKSVKIVDTMPGGFTEIDFSDLDPAWDYVYDGTPADGGTITYTYNQPFNAGDPLPPIIYTATTSLEAPASGFLRNDAVLTVTLPTDQVAPTVLASAAVTVQQAEVAAIEKSLNGPSLVEVTDEVSWISRWVNYQNASQGRSYFVDVLPFDGDPRGSSFGGTYKVSEAAVDFAGLYQLQYTTDPSATVLAAAPNSNAINWIDASGSWMDTAGITGLRVVVDDFVAGPDGSGTLAVSLDPSGNAKGDIYVNNAQGFLSVAGATVPALGLVWSHDVRIDVTASSVSGIVWLDADKDGVQDASESPVAGSVVELLNDAGAVVRTATTTVTGYVFRNLHSGSYSVRVADPGFNAGPDDTVINTYDLDGDLDEDSGSFDLGITEDLEHVDFGYFWSRPSIEIAKEGKLVGNAVVGGAVTWSFTVTNTGNVTLAAVELVDDLPGIGAIEWGTWPGPAHELAPGESVTATAPYALTQADLDAGHVTNIASCTATSTDDTDVTCAPDDATVSYPVPTRTPTPTPTPTPTSTSTPTSTLTETPTTQTSPPVESSSPPTVYPTTSVKPPSTSVAPPADESSPHAGEPVDTVALPNTGAPDVRALLIAMALSLLGGFLLVRRRSRHGTS